jgi:hypothetical protein
VRRDAIKPFEGVDSLTVGQGEVDQHSVYCILVFSFAAEPLYGLGAAPNPFDSNGFAVAKQCRLNGPGVRSVMLDEKYRLRHLRVAGNVAGNVNAGSISIQPRNRHAVGAVANELGRAIPAHRYHRFDAVGRQIRCPLRNVVCRARSVFRTHPLVDIRGAARNLSRFGVRRPAWTSVGIHSNVLPALGGNAKTTQQR